MNADYWNYRRYKKARRKFAIKSYFLLSVWLLLGIIQWCIVCLTDRIRKIFFDHYVISSITFAVALLLLYIYLCIERLRFVKCLNVLICVLIVELQIISLFALVAGVYWPDLISFFALCVLVLFMAIFIGSILPRRIDLTQNVAVLFIYGFFCILGAIFILMCSFLIPEKKPGHILYKEFGSYLIFELLISVMILVFVMYHAQTIQGSRFAEMRLNDFLLASLILFHDFLIIYWLTFYWQYKEKPFTSDKILRTTSDPTGTPDDDDSKSASRRILGKHTAAIHGDAQKHTETTLQTVIEVTDDYYDATIVTSSKDSEVESSIEVSKSTDVDYYFDIEVSKSTIVTSSRAREVESSIEVSKSTDVDYYFDIEVSKSTDVDYYFDIREVPLAMTHDSSDTIFGITGDTGDEPSEFFGDESIMSNNKKEEQDLYAPQHTSEPLTITFDFMEDGIATASKSMIQRRWDRITKDDSDMFINIKKPTDNHISTEELRRYNVKETEIEFM